MGRGRGCHPSPNVARFHYRERHLGPSRPLEDSGRREVLPYFHKSGYAPRSCGARARDSCCMSTTHATEMPSSLSWPACLAFPPLSQLVGRPCGIRRCHNQGQLGAPVQQSSSGTRKSCTMLDHLKSAFRIIVQYATVTAGPQLGVWP